ncbi:MAG: DUF4870 domain-containing protein [Thermomonospora sp. CIF 1]|nr:MAG: DUF4870 domain-containing protein [Thermomonospora sp. CIF 1]
MPGPQPGQGRQGPWQQQPPGRYLPPPPAPPPGQYGLPAPAYGGPAPVMGPASPQEEKWALMAYLGQLQVSAIAPLAALISKGGSPFVRRHAAQALNMGLGMIVVWVVGLLLAQFMDALALFPLAYSALFFYFLLRAAIAVNRGEFLQVPSFIAWPLLK